MPKFVNDWRGAWKNRFFREQFLISLIAILLAMVLMRFFLSYVEKRSGIGLPDPVLSLLTPMDLKWIIYGCIYSAFLLALGSFALHPFALLLVLRGMTVLILLRILFLYLLPLDPPPGIIPLADPFLRMPVVFPPTSRDLFFSWPTAVITLFGFSAQWKDIRIIFFCAAGVVSALLLLQHAHYTLDVIGAPFFAFVAYAIARANTLRETSGAVSGPPHRSGR